ncbi:MAG: DUF3866 family protein [Actinomycetota bacterium]
MVAFRTGTVDALLAERRGLQRVTVDGQRAYVLTDLIGEVAVGDHVVVNTTAVDLGLGTGGWHVVHWNLTRERRDEPGPGHIMKLRYTSLQVDTGSYEEHEPTDAQAEDGLDGLPVVVAGLHSLVAPIAAAVRQSRRGARIAYVMTDDAALPLVLSDLVADLTASGILDVTITAGQAFGGDHEAVNVASGLWAARHRLDADLAIVAMGPGNVGTGTTLGHAALGQVPVIDLAGRLGGEVTLALRASGVDARDRHRGLSHHSTTVLRLAGGPLTVAVPGRWRDLLDPQLAEIDGAHRVEHVAAREVLGDLRDAGIELRSMGRRAADDPCFVDCAAAAGQLAAAQVTGP